MRTIIQLIGCTILAAGIAGCATNQVGPARPITIDEEVAWVRDLLEHDLASFYGADPTTQAYIRNEIVTARMYIADMEYDYYEARLTREMQDEGLLATATELGLTTAATLVPVAQTKTLLSALATGVVGLDKAYTEKELLSNTIQALQTQMRADRKTEAGAIYGKMYRDPGNNTRKITSIAEYTLPMALSDADAYYHAGTISSSLIGLSKTVARAERNADQAKISTGPNPEVVSTVKEIAAPQSAPLVPAVRPFILPRSTARAFRESIPSSARAPLAGAGGQPGLTKSETIGHPQTEVEQRMPIPVGRQIQGNLCVSVPDGNFGAETRRPFVRQKPLRTRAGSPNKHPRSLSLLTIKSTPRRNPKFSSLSNSAN